jgi:hypothetical protein
MRRSSYPRRTHSFSCLPNFSFASFPVRLSNYSSAASLPTFTPKSPFSLSRAAREAVSWFFSCNSF